MGGNAVPSSQKNSSVALKGGRILGRLRRHCQVEVLELQRERRPVVSQGSGSGQPERGTYVRCRVERDLARAWAKGVLDRAPRFGPAHVLGARDGAGLEGERGRRHGRCSSRVKEDGGGGQAE